jgi:Family of unknown function (DUF6445)
MLFKRSSDAQLSVLEVGEERSPVIVIDDLLAQPSVLFRYACDHRQFSKVDGNLYPGVRAPMPLGYVEGAVRALDPLIRNTYEIGDAVLSNAECFFSIVTTSPSDLQPLQKVPHIDTTDPLHFAVVHFLCDGAFGGTAFYRQRATGYETIGPDREVIWAAARDEALFLMPDNVGYVDDSSADYVQIGLIPAKFDRLVLYRSNLLHSGFIPNHMPFSQDPKIGRLTANFFIGYRNP